MGIIPKKKYRTTGQQCNSTASESAARADDPTTSLFYSNSYDPEEYQNSVNELARFEEGCDGMHQQIEEEVETIRGRISGPIIDKGSGLPVPSCIARRNKKTRSIMSRDYKIEVDQIDRLYSLLDGINEINNEIRRSADRLINIGSKDAKVTLNDLINSLETIKSDMDAQQFLIESNAEMAV